MALVSLLCWLTCWWNKNIVTHLCSAVFLECMHFFLPLIWSQNCTWQKKRQGALQNTASIHHRECVWYISNNKAVNYTNSCEWCLVITETCTANPCIFWHEIITSFNEETGFFKKPSLCKWLLRQLDVLNQEKTLKVFDASYFTKLQLKLYTNISFKVWGVLLG